MIVTPDNVYELMDLTGKNENECIDAILSSDTHEEAKAKLQQTSIIDLYKKVRVGSIVVIENPRLSPFEPGEVSKVLGLLKPGVKSKSVLTIDITEHPDTTKVVYHTNPGSKLYNSIIVLETFNLKAKGTTYNGKSCNIEFLASLRLATTEEKKKYYKYKQGKG